MKNIKVWQIWSIIMLICLATFSVSAGDSVNSFKQWNTVGPSGGDVRSITIDPKNKDHIFISTINGQVYASYDTGQSWQLLVNLKRPQLILDNLIIDPRDSNVIYTSGHRHKRSGGFFKSVDGGKTWKESSELKKEAVHAMVQSTLDPNMLLVGTVDGVWVSKNSGDTWSRYSSSTTPKKLDALAVDPTDTNTIYAGTWWRAYKTTDGGKNWRLVKKGMIDDSDVFAVDIDPRNPDNVIAAACSGIYKSINKGETWKKVNGIPSQSRRTRDIIHHPSKPGTIFAGTTKGLWMSTNGGTNWRLTSSKNVEINSIAVHPDAPDRIFIATNDYGIMVSNNGGKSFELSSGNFSSRFVYNIVPDSEKPNRLYATTFNTSAGGGYIYVSNDFGRTWKPSVRGVGTGSVLTYSLVQDKADANKIYLATNFGIFRSINRGLNWVRVKAPRAKKRRTIRRSRRRSRRTRTKTKPTTVASKDGKIKAFTKRVNVLTHTEDGKNGYLAGTPEGLYRSYDISKGWEKLNLGEGVKPQVTVIHVSPKMPQVIWVGTARSGVLMSNDNGLTWTKVGTVSDRVPISSIASNPDKPENVYVGTSHTLYMSKDWGKTWARRGGNLPLGNYTSILINPENTDEMYVSSALESDGGIFLSEDAGWTWKRIDTRQGTLPSHRVWSLTFNPNNKNELFAGTHSSGIYQIKRTAQAKKVKKVEEVKKTTKPKKTTTNAGYSDSNN